MYIPQDIDYQQIIAEYGSPVYVYEASRITERYQYLRSLFDIENLSVHFAMKANTNPEVIKLLSALGAGIDAVSPQEVAHAVELGVPTDEVFFTPSGANFSELEEIFDSGIMITIDNLTQLRKWGEKRPNTKVAVRFNPDIHAGGVDKISVGHRGSKFGIAQDQIEEVINIAQSHELKIVGVHIHVGSDVYQMDAFVQVMDSFMELSENLAENLEFINFGGGFKVDYHPDSKPFPLEKLCQLMSDTFHKIEERLGKSLHAIIEPGKFLISEAGTFVTRVNVVKESYGKQFAILNSGFNHLIRPMYYGAYHHILNLDNPEGKEEIIDICGYICEEDTFAHDRELPEVREGDHLLFLNAGAYCYSMASHFNMRMKPREVMWEDGRARLVRESE